MNIIIKTKNIELTPSIESFINKKIGGLKKFLKSFEGNGQLIPGGRDLFETFVDVQKESLHHRKGRIFRAEVKIYIPGRSLFAKSSSDDLIKAITEARDEIEREIRKHKTKAIDLPRRKAMQKSRS